MPALVPRFVIYKGEERPDVIYLTNKSITIGRSENNDVVLKSKQVPRSYRLCTREGRNFYIEIPLWINGTISTPKTTLEIKDLGRFYNPANSKKALKIYIPEDTKGSLIAGALRIEFEFAAPPPPPPKPVKIVKAKVPKEFKRKYITRESRLFYVVLVIVSLLTTGFVYMVNTMNVTQARMPSEFQGIPPRLAKLLIQPPKPVKVAKAAPVPQKTEAQPGPEKGGGAGAGEARHGEAPHKPTRQQMRAAVSAKGLLALIVSRTRTTGTSADVLSKTSAMSLNRALKGIGGFKVAGGVGELKEARGTGLAGGEANIAGIGGGAGKSLSLGGGRGGELTKVANTSEGELSVKGGLSGDIIRQVVNANLASVKYCYEKGLKKNPELRGKVIVEFMIGTDGSVTSSSVIGSTMHEADVEQCIAMVIRRWIFPKPYSGTVDVKFPFIFVPAGA